MGKSAFVVREHTVLAGFRGREEWRGGMETAREEKETEGMEISK